MISRCAIICDLELKAAVIGKMSLIAVVTVVHRHHVMIVNLNFQRWYHIDMNMHI